MSGASSNKSPDELVRNGKRKEFSSRNLSHQATLKMDDLPENELMDPMSGFESPK